VDDGARRRVLPLAGPLPIGRGAATGLRAAAGEILALLAVDEIGAAQRWARTEREDHVEIDGARCGPNTEVTWTWTAPAGRDLRAEVRLATTRWNPDQISHVAASGFWSDGSRSIHAHLDGPGGAAATDLTVSGPPELLATVGALLVVQLAGGGGRGPGSS